MISQIDLFAGIAHLLEKHGISDVNERQMNAILKAATDIHDALTKEHHPAIREMGLAKWLASDDTGLSSRYMASVLSLASGASVHCGRTRSSDGAPAYPLDPDDFGRCVRMLDACPELSPHIPALAENSGLVWKAIAERWGNLEMLYREELPSGSCPKLYDELQKIRETAEGATP